MRSLAYRPSIFVEPFVGGGIVAVTVAFENFADHVEIIELDPEVAAVWKAITSPDFGKLSRRILEFEVNEDNVRRELAGTSSTVDGLAFRTIIKNRMQHGGILAPGASLMKNGENGKGLLSRWYPKTLATRINAIGEIRDKFTVIEGDGIAEMRKHSSDRTAAFFIDPPYTASGKKAGRRLYRFNELDHEDLFDVAKKLSGQFLMTYDNADGVQSMADDRGFEVELVAMKNTHHAKMTELLISKNIDWVRASAGEHTQREFTFD